MTAIETITVAPPVSDAAPVRRKRPFVIFGFACGVVVILLVTLGPFVFTQDPYDINATEVAQGPSAAHWLGTDDLGRDMAARLAVGGRTSLLIAFVAVALSTVLSVGLGVITGFFGGPVDAVVTRVVDLFFAIPGMLVTLGVVGLLGPTRGGVTVAIAVSYWAGYTRLVRSEVVGLRSRPYVEASHMIGVPAWRIVTREIMTGLMPLILVQSTALVGAAIMTEAALGYLGLGVQPPNPSWGSALEGSRQFIQSYIGMGLIAGIPILLSVLSVSILSDHLRDRLDSRRTGR